MFLKQNDSLLLLPPLGVVDHGEKWFPGLDILGDANLYVIGCVNSVPGQIKSLTSSLNEISSTEYNFQSFFLVFQVTVGSEKGTGSGPNKKLAKRAAAENVLVAMGYAKPAPQPARSAIKSGGGDDDHDEVEEGGGGSDKGKKVRQPRFITSYAQSQRPMGPRNKN